MKKEELTIIKQAIINEIEGYEFYKMAAEKANTMETKSAFEELAKEELKHSEYLQDLFNNIKDNEGDDFKLAFLVNPPSPKIFNWGKIDRDSASLAVSVFGIGVQMEKESVEFYKNAKEKTQYEEAKKLYDILIGWERTHLEQFEEQYQLYQDEWWNKQGFAPF